MTWLRQINVVLEQQQDLSDMKISKNLNCCCFAYICWNVLMRKWLWDLRFLLFWNKLKYQMNVVLEQQENLSSINISKSINYYQCAHTCESALIRRWIWDLWFLLFWNRVMCQLIETEFKKYQSKLMLDQNIQ